jgi:hypothetical protein
MLRKNRVVLNDQQDFDTIALHRVPFDGAIWP